MCDLKGFHTLLVVRTILKRILDCRIGVFSAFLQIGFVLNEFVPRVENVLSNREWRSGLEGSESFDGENIFVLATIAKILSIEILG